MPRSLAFTMRIIIAGLLGASPVTTPYVVLESVPSNMFQGACFPEQAFSLRPVFFFRLRQFARVFWEGHFIVLNPRSLTVSSHLAQVARRENNKPLRRNALVNLR